MSVCTTFSLCPPCPHANRLGGLTLFSSHSLQDTGAVDPTSQYIRKVWTCPSCQSKIAVTLAERLQHQAQCKATVEGSRNGFGFFPPLYPRLINVISIHTVKEDLPEPEAGADKRDYYCSVCGKDLKLTSIEILKHKRAHAQTSAV